jgi:hypothetical protein
MTDQTREDHDQRLKVLLKEFFRHFFSCFFPVWAERFDFDHVAWDDKEVFLAPPQGEKRQLDLIARIHLRDDAPPVRTGVRDLMALIHIELESRESALALRPRMFEYYVHLRRDSELPVLPIGLFLRVGLDGIGWDTYEEHFWENRILRFEYAYIGLPALDGEHYALGENVVGAALSSLMRVPPERRAEVYAEALKRIAKSGENDYRVYLLAECLEAYANLGEAETERLEKLLTTEQYQEVRPIMITTYERGRFAERLESALLQLEEKFGPLSPEVRQRVESMPPDTLRQTMIAFVKAESLKDLGLQD